MEGCLILLAMKEIKMKIISIKIVLISLCKGVDKLAPSNTTHWWLLGHFAYCWDKTPGIHPQFKTILVGKSQEAVDRDTFQRVLQVPNA